MVDFEQLFISPAQTIRESAKIIDLGAVQIALVVDKANRLLGTVTDGDVRRGLLEGENFEAPVESVMCRGFRSLQAGCTEDEAMQLMQSEQLHQVPVLNDEGCVIYLYTLDELLKPAVLPNRVVIMAGGEGRRLRPKTENCPKPMLPVAGRPILEIILGKCVDAGLSDIFIAVNYLKEQIMDHFQDGQNFGLEIQYLVEQQPMGTAGALSLLPAGSAFPMLVMNGDVLTRVNLSRLLQFHERSGSCATICVHEHRSQVPYGVVRTEDHRVVAIEEKPVVKHHVNAGLYVLNPEVVGQMQAGEPRDMTGLLESCLDQEPGVSAFLIHEFWADIGLHDSHHRADLEWKGNRKVC